jgi:predicted ABC-type ATPase
LERFASLVDAALAANDSFVYEGHFTNDATWDVPKRFKDNGYKINLIFFGLANPALSELRVVERSKSRGHYVPPIEAESNFFGNLDKLNQYYSIIDDLTIVDTSETVHIVLLHMVNGAVKSTVPYNELPEWFIERLPSIAEKIKLTE